jgi:SAM domain (Sterile alpha motif)
MKTLCCRGSETLVAAMPQISDWLEKLGMSDYAQRFTENDFDIAMSDVGMPHILQLSKAITFLIETAQNLGISRSKEALSCKIKQSCVIVLGRLPLRRLG